MQTKEMIEKALALVDTAKSEYSGMTYEQGIEEALMWVLEEMENDEFSFMPNESA